MTIDNIKNHKHILLCGDNFNSLGIVRSLGEAGLSVYVIVFGGAAHSVNRSRYTKVCDVVQTLDDGFRLLLDKYGHELQKPFLYAGSDNVIGLLDSNRDMLMDKFYLFHGREQGSINAAMNKHTILEMAEEAGLNVLKNIVVKRGEIPQGIKYPIITKAIMPTQYAWKSDMIICNDEDELIAAYTRITSAEVLIQEYLDKKNELAINGISYNDGENMVSVYGHSYYRMERDNYGGYLYLYPHNNHELMAKVQRILQKVGYNGIFEVEFLVGKDEQLYFLEINFRNAAFSYAYTYGGLNLPVLWAEAMLKGTIDTSNIKVKKNINVMTEPDDYRIEVVRAGKSFLHWYRSFHDIDCYLMWNRNDIKPGLAWWLLKIIQHIKSGSLL